MAFLTKGWSRFQGRSEDYRKTDGKTTTGRLYDTTTTVLLRSTFGKASWEWKGKAKEGASSTDLASRCTTTRVRQKAAHYDFTTAHRRRTSRSLARARTGSWNCTCRGEKGEEKKCSGTSQKDMKPVSCIGHGMEMLQKATSKCGLRSIVKQSCCTIATQSLRIEAHHSAKTFTFPAHHSLPFFIVVVVGSLS